MLDDAPPTDVIVFVGRKRDRSGRGMELLDEPGESTLSVETIRRNLRAFTDNLQQMLPDLQPGAHGFALDEFTVAVGIDGKGKVGFLGTGAEAGASATLTLTFKKPDVRNQ